MEEMDFVRYSLYEMEVATMQDKGMIAESRIFQSIYNRGRNITILVLLTDLFGCSSCYQLSIVKKAAAEKAL